MLNFKKGKYRVINYKKYKGDPTGVVYRSGWEHEVMKWCDSNPNVKRWWSEEVAIPYRKPTDGKVHRYFPDFYVKVRGVDGRVKQHLVEVKPRRQINGPKVRTDTRNKAYITEVKTFATNTAKWEAASEFCRDRGWEWTLVDENDLQIRFFGRKSKR